MESLCWMCLDWRDKTLNQTLRFRKVENWLETKPEGKHRCQCLVTHPTSEKTVHGQGHHSQSGGGPDVWPLSMSQSRMDRLPTDGLALYKGSSKRTAFAIPTWGNCSNISLNVCMANVCAVSFAFSLSLLELQASGKSRKAFYLSCHPFHLAKFSIMQFLFIPFRRKPVVSPDVNLRRSLSWN